jgi:SAM-dependent methyltransferase
MENGADDAESDRRRSRLPETSIRAVSARQSSVGESFPAAGDPPQFQGGRRSDNRDAPPWHRYAYHIRTLPRALEALVEDLHLPDGGRVLDYGCADLPYRHFFHAGADYVGADLAGNPQATLELNPDGTIPSPEHSFDAIMSTQVLEHVTDPALYLGEAFRVLRPGGRMLLSTHGTFVYHPDPDDYWRWTCAGLQRAVREAGFDVARFEGIVGLLPTGIQLVQDAIYWHLPRVLRAPFALVMQTLMAIGDRLHSPGSRALNSQAFALVAEKP